MVCHFQVPRLVLLKREIDILRAVDHPTLIKLEDVYEDDVNLHLVRTAILDAFFSPYVEPIAFFLGVRRYRDKRV